jgi:hypothetical protein
MFATRIFVKHATVAHGRRTVWAALRTTPLPTEVVVAHVLLHLHAEADDDLFVGQLDFTRAASMLGIRLPDSDEPASPLKLCEQRRR